MPLLEFTSQKKRPVRTPLTGHFYSLLEKKPVRTGFRKNQSFFIQGFPMGIPASLQRLRNNPAIM